MPYLERALILAREIGDRSRVAELSGDLGIAHSTLGRPARAFELFEQGIAEARSIGDLFGQKLLLERRGRLEASLKRSDDALTSYERALGLARQVGDHHQEGFLLWRIGSLHAELGDRERADDRCSEAIGLFRSLGKPHAAWFQQHLDRFRKESPEKIGLPAGVQGRRIAEKPPAAKPTTAGILQMAVSASKAMASFVGSGMRPVSPEVRDWRRSTCASCERHTGIRCRVCGCFTQVKTQLGGESCPIGRW